MATHRLAGARIWAKWHLVGQPRYELWEYKGQVQVAGVPAHKFQGYKRAGEMYLSHVFIEVNASNFRPFLINTEDLNANS